MVEEIELADNAMLSRVGKSFSNSPIRVLGCFLDSNLSQLTLFPSKSGSVSAFQTLIKLWAASKATLAWEQRKLGEITSELSEYATLESGLPLLTSSRSGLLYQNEYRGNQATYNDETLFSVVPLGSCTYRHMSDDDVFHMNINTLVKGLVSREYPVFLATKNNDLDFMIQHINSSRKFRTFCKEQKKGGTRTRLYYKAFGEFAIMTPSYQEQQTISRFLNSLDDLITLHQRKEA